MELESPIPQSDDGIRRSKGLKGLNVVRIRAKRDQSITCRPNPAVEGSIEKNSVCRNLNARKKREIDIEKAAYYFDALTAVNLYTRLSQSLWNTCQISRLPFGSCDTISRVLLTPQKGHTGFVPASLGRRFDREVIYRKMIEETVGLLEWLLGVFEGLSKNERG